MIPWRNEKTLTKKTNKATSINSPSEDESVTMGTKKSLPTKDILEGNMCWIRSFHLRILFDAKWNIINEIIR